MTMSIMSRWNRCPRMVPVVGAVLLVSTAVSLQAQYATEVLRYESGTGFATEFGTGLGYTLTSAVLGEPSRFTPGPFGGPVDPFSPPYQREQLLSVGQGGLLEIRLDQPLLNDPRNPFGIDLLVFSNTGFVIINGDFSGGGITDGSRFGDDGGTARISVSADGLQYYVLDPVRAPGLESGLPTAGAGDFTRPADPGLSQADLAGLGLAGLGLRYDGSAGGTGYDLAWALDAGGQSVNLASASYVRIEVLSGRVDLDGVAAVRSVPEPGTIALLAVGLGGCLLARRRVRVTSGRSL
jgi:hypothetical protein